VPWRARTVRPILLRRRASRPQLKRDPLGRGAHTVLRTRKLPVPITWPEGRVGAGHLLPQLILTNPNGFLCVPGHRLVEHGVLAHIGEDVDASDILKRWAREVPAPQQHPEFLARLERYIQQLQGFKIGNVLAIRYAPDSSFQLHKVAERPGTQRAPLP